jgi:hypothetical protein
MLSIERAPRFHSEAEVADDQHLAETLKDAGGDTGRLLLESAGEIAQQPLGLVSGVEFPGLPERSAHRFMKRLGQAFNHVARFVNLTTSDRRVGTEASTNDFAWRHATVDDEQPLDLGVEPAFDHAMTFNGNARNIDAPTG